ncbi:MAG: hypothetical protein ACO20A_08805 [Candidatus Nanopelagicales bacterium]
MIDMLLAAEPASVPVTQWPLRILLVLVVLAVIALVLVGMRRGWLRRARAQQDIPAPPLPAAAADDGTAVAGVYVGSTLHGDWLDRVVVHDLGVRSRMRAQVTTEGVAIRREGARDLLIPAASLRGAGFGRGIAGKAYERDGVLVITWDLGGRLMDTGLRADVAEDQRQLLESVLAMHDDAGGVSR